MRFSYAESMCDPAPAIAAREGGGGGGYTSFTVPDSICYPQDSDSRYPYTPDGDRGFLEDKPFIEPFALIPALGAGDDEAALHDLRREARRSAIRCSSRSRRRRSRC